jgi:hypothetical protein
MVGASNPHVHVAFSRSLALTPWVPSPFSFSSVHAAGKVAMTSGLPGVCHECSVLTSLLCVYFSMLQHVLRRQYRQ